MPCFGVHFAFFSILTPCSLVGGYESLSSLVSHTAVAAVSGFLECFAVATGKQLLNSMLGLDNEGTTMHQNSS